MNGIKTERYALHGYCLYVVFYFPCTFCSILVRQHVIPPSVFPLLISASPVCVCVCVCDGQRVQTVDFHSTHRRMERTKLCSSGVLGKISRGKKERTKRIGMYASVSTQGDDIVLVWTLMSTN